VEAIILAGGQGKRLKPLTDYVPKPLVPLCNIPIIEWQIRYLKKFGVNKIVVCSGYKAQMIQNYFSVKNNMGLEIKFSIEKTPLGTGGAIRQAGKLIQNESFIVINGDIITNIDLKKLLESPNSIAAIELRTKFGIMDTRDNKVIKFREKKEIPEVWMNAGIYYLKKNVLKDLPKKGDIEKTVFPNYAKKGLLNTVKFRNIAWYSIDSLKDIEECSKDICKIIK
jgi:NDP-sugar pyrophosphorylase family protein